MMATLPLPLPTLDQCLHQRNYDQVLEIAYHYRLVLNKDRKTHKLDLIHRLESHLVRRALVRRKWQRLDKNERSALLALIARHGSAPYQEFVQRFGAFAPAPRQRRSVPPSEQVQTPTSRLALLGLIYPFAAGKGKVPTHVVIPRELLHYFPRSIVLSPVGTTRPLPPDPTFLMADLALWLAEVHYTAPPRRQSGLPPLAVLQALNARLYQPAQMQSIRRVTQAGRTTFLAFLAESSGMVETSQTRLTLTPHAWQWAAEGAARRLDSLWQAWKYAPAAIWQHYGQPHLREVAPTLVRDALIEALRDLPLDTPYPLEVWCRALIRRDDRFWHLTPWWDAEAGTQRLLRCLTDLLVGPFQWLTIIAPDATGRAFYLTATGAWLLRGGAAPVFSAPAPARLRPDASLFVPDTPEPATLLCLNAFAEWQGGVAAGGMLYRLSPASIHRAHAFGYTLTGLKRQLRAITDTPVPRPLQRTIRDWLRQTQPVRLRRVTILETQDSEMLEQLSRAVPVRRALRQTLHPHMAIVAEKELPALLRQLAAQDIPIPPLALALPPAPIPLGHNAMVATALLFYRTFAPELGMNGTLPPALVETVLAQVEPLALTAIEQQLSDAGAAFRRLVDGYAPPPPLDAPAAETNLALLRPALAEPLPPRLCLTYIRVSDDSPSQHRIRPLRIEWDGEVPYLRAYSYAAEAEHRFRVDRVLAIDP